MPQLISILNVRQNKDCNLMLCGCCNRIPTVQDVLAEAAKQVMERWAEVAQASASAAQTVHYSRT